MPDRPSRHRFRPWRAAWAWLFAACAALAAPGPRPAPPGTYGFRSYGPEQGLTNLSINALAQDKQGFLWVGTEDGLFRLEGTQMRRFGTEQGLPDSFIDGSGLCPTRGGGLWVTTRKGAVLWNGERFLPPSALGVAGWDREPGLTLAPGAVILKDRAHRRALVTERGQIEFLEGLPRILGMAGAWMSEDGRELLVLLAGRLYRRIDGRWSSRDLSAYLQGNLLAVLRDRKGRTWVRSEQGLVRFSAMDAEPEILGGRMALSASNGGCLAEDASGRVWTNTAGSLAWFGEHDAGTLSEARGLPQGGANVLLVDREDTLWIGGDGLHRQLGRFVWEGFTRRQGLPAHVVWCLRRSSDGLLWAGTAAGLAVGDGRGWSLVPGTAQRQFMALAEDRGGDLWIAPSMAAAEPPWILRRRSGQRRVERVPLEGLKPGTSAAALAPGPDGSLWVGTDAEGLHRLRRQGARWVLRAEPVPGWPREATTVTCLQSPTEGTLWVAANRGLAHLEGGAWHVLAKGEGLADDDPLALASAAAGGAWVSYRSAKVLSEVRDQGGALRVVRTLRAPHPLLAQPISSLALESTGRLWLGTSLGVLRWDGQRIERFGKSWGLPGEDCAQNAAWLDPDGDAWFGLSAGIAHFHAERYPGLEPLPGARILGIQDGSGAALAAPEGGALRIPWSRRTVAFAYLPRSYARADACLYQVRLQGLEDEWRDTGLPEARYPNLAAGRYRFEVRVKDAVGGTGPAAAVDFAIATPWWQTWTFRLAVLGLLGAATYLGVRWRLGLLRRRNEELERVVQARTEALAAANRSLEELSMGDPLTHLRNRRYLGVTMPEEVARILRMFQTHLARGEGLAGRNEDMLLLLVDLDRFKAVNDNHGHRAGDEVLRQTGELLREACRESDTLVRWGGEEFLVLAKRSNRESGDVIARNIVEAFRAHGFLLPDGSRIRCTCCVGYTAFPVLPAEPDAFRWEEAVELADQCLYAAKNSGRDAWVGAYCASARKAGGLKPGLLVNLKAFVDAGDFQLRSSLADPGRLKWKEFDV